MIYLCAISEAIGKSKSHSMALAFLVCASTFGVVVAAEQSSPESVGTALIDTTMRADTAAQATPQPSQLITDTAFVEDGPSDPYRFWTRYDPYSSVENRNPTPSGYRRLDRAGLSGFGRWLAGMPMRGVEEPLLRFQGDLYLTPERIGGVVDISINSPSEDARGILYRLIVEYCRHFNRELDVTFANKGADSLRALDWFTGEFKTNHDKTKLIFTPGDQKSVDEVELLKFTGFAIAVTNYASLVRDAREIPEDSVAPGDIFVQLDSLAAPPIGHVSICLDVAQWDSASASPNTRPVKTKNKSHSSQIYLWGNCLTPATSFHLVRPFTNSKGNWFAEGELGDRYSNLGPGRYFRLPYSFLR